MIAYLVKLNSYIISWQDGVKIGKKPSAQNNIRNCIENRDMRVDIGYVDLRNMFGTNCNCE